MSHSAPSESYEIVIEPNHGWLSIDLRALWEYRDLLALLVRREFLSKYKQTILGPAWFVINPLLTTLVFTVVFGRVAQIPTDGLPPVLFYLCGLLSWSYFSQVVATGTASFQSNAAMFSKVYFPRLTVPLSIVIATLCAFALQLLTFAGFYLYYKLFVPEAANINPSWYIVLLPLLLLQAGALSLGVTLWICAATVKYRDLMHLSQFLLQLWMYATPVIYPVSKMVSKLPPRLAWITGLNPMCTVVEGFRLGLLGRGTIEPGHLVSSLIMTILILFSGVMVYQRNERIFADLA